MREFKGFNVHGWIAIAGMVAIAIYVVLARIFRWGSLEVVIAFIAASTYFITSQLGRIGEGLVSMDARLLEVRDLAEEIRDSAKEIVEVLKKR